MKGPAPKPNAIKKAEGNRGRRPLTKEPRHAPGSPRKPKAMSRAAGEVWQEFIETMDPVMLCHADRRALWQLAEDEAILSEAYQGFWRMVDALKKKAKADGTELPAGEIMSLMQMKNGKVAMNAIRDLGARVITERREFGMTPSSRSRIDLASKDPFTEAIDDAIFNRPAELLILPKSG